MGLRIAMLGTRGVPATFGGVERHVEEIGRRLVARGHEVTVYAQSKYLGDARVQDHLGMRVVRIPTLPSRSLEAIAHSAMSTVAAMTGGYDVVHYHAVGPGLVAPLPRYFGRARVVQTIHGLDGERAKWGRVAQTILNVATWMSARVPHETVTVSSALASHYRERYDRSCATIVNGVTPRFRASGRHHPVQVRPRSGRLLPVRRPAGAGEAPRPADQGVRRARHRQATGDRRRLELHRRLRRRPAPPRGARRPHPDARLRLRRRARRVLHQRPHLRPALRPRGASPHAAGSHGLRHADHRQRHRAPPRGGRPEPHRCPPVPRRRPRQPGRGVPVDGEGPGGRASAPPRWRRRTSRATSTGTPASTGSRPSTPDRPFPPLPPRSRFTERLSRSTTR